MKSETLPIVCDLKVTVFRAIQRPQLQDLIPYSASLAPAAPERFVVEGPVAVYTWKVIAATNSYTSRCRSTKFSSHLLEIVGV
jgi:hypothetical protein